MKNISILYFLLVISLLACNQHEQISEKSGFEKAIVESRRLVDSIQQNGKIPGIDVAVYISGEIVWSEGFGFTDLEHNTPVIPGKTRFRIGSVSKPLTVAALGKLMDLEKVDLNLPVQTYVPYFPIKKYPITVKQISGHIAGIRHYRGKEMLMKNPYNSVESSIAIFSDDSLLFEPGSKYSYSSYAFNLLSAVIEGASGEKFLPYIQGEVFLPLDMISTSPDKNDSIILNRTSFYQLDSLNNIINAPYVDNSYKWAGGGFISTTTDLIKFGEAHLKPGFLSAETLNELTTSQVLNNGDSTGYGIGWVCLQENQLQGYGHSGGSVGGITQFKIYPDEKLIIVLLSNSSNTNYGNVVDRIVKMFLEAKEK
ncbi:MAG: serine hydrolase domain-containing protein [Bacteroidota bacterium]|nr:serine hydrolase domain-containing protein [Bacteroidota bacterium]